MNAEIKSQWVDALRSGKYAQGQFGLRETVDGETTYCCLGVLCELATEAGVVSEVQTNVELFHSVQTTSYDGATAFLPESVQSWAGLDSRNGFIGDYELHNHPYVSLTAFNDNEVPFSTIADVIEESF